MSKRSIVALAVLLVVGVAANVITVPYYSESPGPPREVEPLIKVQGHPVYPSAGHLVMTSVLQSSGRLSAIAALVAWLDPNVALVKETAILYPGETQQQERTRAISQMDQSKLDAASWVLRHLTEYPDAHGTGALIEGVVPGCPADGELFAGDVITSIDGTPIRSQTAASKAIDAVPSRDPIRFQVRAAGRSHSIALRRADCTDQGKRPIVGISIIDSFPFPVTIESGDVGGPSAGLMWALGLYDLLTPGDLTGGRTIAGTGQIDLQGNVYAIGGVQEKVVAAEHAGADEFLVPKDNLKEAQRVAGDLRLVPISSVQGAIDHLSHLSHLSGAARTSTPSPSPRPTG